MGGENHRGFGFRNLVKLAYKNGAFSFEIIDDETVMDDLMTHIDRRAIGFERRLDHINGTHDPGAETARGAKQDREWRFQSHAGVRTRKLACL